MKQKDIKKLQEEYSELSKKYHALLENTAEGIWCFELEDPLPIDTPEDEMIRIFFDKGFLAECNDIMAKMYGFEKREEILGAKLSDLLIPDDPRNIEYLRAFIRNGFRLVNGESYEKDKEGNLHIFLNNLIGEIENDRIVRAWGTQRDITELRQKEKALEESEKKFRRLFENMAEGQTILKLIQENNKLDFLIVDINSSLERALEIRKENFIGKRMSEFHNMSFLPGLNDFLRIRDTQKSLSFETYLPTKNKYFLISVYHILGNLFGFTFLDVTDIRNINRKNVLLNKMLKAIRNVNQLIVKERDQEKLINGICKHLVETRVFKRVWIVLTENGNPISFATCGWRKSGKPIREYVLTRGLTPCMHATLKNKEAIQLNPPAKMCKGCFLEKHCKGLYIHHYPLRQQERIYGVLQISSSENIFDISEYKELFIEIGMDISYALYTLEMEENRKNAERKIKDYSEQIEKFSKVSADILAVEDEKEFFKLVCNSIVEISDFQRLLLYIFKDEPPYREILGHVGVAKSVIEKMKRAHVPREKLKQIFERGIRLGKQSCYLPHTMKDVLEDIPVDYGKREYEPGEGRWHKEDNLFVALLDKNGEMMGMISLDDSKSGLIPTDETVKPIEIFANFISQVIIMRNMEKKNRQMQESLAHFEKIRALGEMAGGVAHDFNNILSAILGRAQILRRFNLPPEVDHGLKLIEKAALDGAETVRRIQDFTRLRKDRHFTTLNVNDVISDAVRYLKARWKDEAEKKGVYFNIVKHYGKIPVVEGNPSELREVFTNIISNAIDAMPDGGDIIINTSREGDNIVVSIRDTGVGMSQEVAKRIFDPFFTTKGVKGSGLGMSISYGIISRHGGKIAVNSKLGKGTEVIVTLPVAKLVPQKTREKKEIKQKRGAPINKILIVDDEEGPRSLLYDILKLLNYDVVAARDGIEALEVFRKNPDIDVVFTDLGMPHISGWELTKKLRQQKEDLVIVIITGWGSQIDEKKMKEEGVDRVLAKPFELAQIQETVIECSLIKEKKLNKKGNKS